MRDWPNIAMLSKDSLTVGWGDATDSLRTCPEVLITVSTPPESLMDVMLTSNPELIYLKFENAKWQIHKDLERGVYPMKVTNKVWIVPCGVERRPVHYRCGEQPDRGVSSLDLSLLGKFR